MQFRPCIDLKDGAVVQIVGGSLDANGRAATNHVSARPADWFARRYRDAALPGGHVIALGSGNADAARAALAAWPGGLQYGGGVTIDNADCWLQAGASHVIVTSWLFPGGQLDRGRLESLADHVGRERLVLDLSCRQRDGRWHVVTDRWRRFSDTVVDAATLDSLSGYCAEYLVHGVDVEGRRQGVETALLELLADASPIPVTYAGGVGRQTDIDTIERLGRGRVHFTVGSALDLFGGALSFDDLASRYGSGRAPT